MFISKYNKLLNMHYHFSVFQNLSETNEYFGRGERKGRMGGYIHEGLRIIHNNK